MNNHPAFVIQFIVVLQMEQEQRIANLERLLAEQAAMGLAASPSPCPSLAVLVGLRRISLRWRSAAVARALDEWAAAAAAATSFVAEVITMVLLLCVYLLVKQRYVQSTLSNSSQLPETIPLQQPVLQH